MIIWVFLAFFMCEKDEIAQKSRLTKLVGRAD